jgi:hypothetical protein
MPSIISTKTSGGGGIAVTGDTSGVLQLQSANGTTAVTIDASQNVGIGTGSPSSKLTVANSNVTVNAGYGIAFTGDQDRIMTPEDNVSGALIKWASVGICRFLSASTERMRIDASGNVLVGATSAGSYAAGSAIGTTGYISRSGTAGSFGNNRFNIFWNGSAARLWIDTVDQGSISVSSDYRIKTDVQAQTLTAIDRIAQLKPVTYTYADNETLNWKADGVAREGFIAHELQEIIPSAVDGEKDAENQIQSLKLDALCSVMVKAIQEQQAIITDLKARIEVLEGASA